MERDWVRLCSGTAHAVSAGGTTLDVAAPLGEPPVFYRAGSAVGEELSAALPSL